MPIDRSVVLAWRGQVRALLSAVDAAVAVPMARSVRDALVAGLVELEKADLSLSAALERMEREQDRA